MDEKDAFIPPAPVKPGFDRVEDFTTPAERWGYNARPSKMKQPLPEGWWPSRPLTSEEEQRLADMHLWAKADGVMMADWDAFWEGSWLRKQQREKDGKSATAALKQLGERTGGNAAEYVPGSAGPKPLELDHGKGRPRIKFLPS